MKTIKNIFLTITAIITAAHLFFVQDFNQSDNFSSFQDNLNNERKKAAETEVKESVESPADNSFRRIKIINNIVSD